MAVTSEELIERRRRQRRRRTRRRIVLAAVAVVVAPVLYSYVSTMSKPSSLPLSIRTVEWIRSNHGAWLVNTVEHYWYSLNAPSPGGPTLKALPSLDLRYAQKPVVRRRRRVTPYRPARLGPVLHPALAGEGVWHGVGPLVGGSPPVLVTTFRSDLVYPRIVAYVAWIDHTRTQLALYPGRYQPPGASPRGPMEVPAGARGRLLATFNSGFTYDDGHGGFAVDGHTATPLQKGQGTVVAYRDGRVDIVDWQGGQQAPRWVVAARQNLPLLVDHGRPSPLLADGSLWGSTLGNAVRVWRSAVGIDRHGNLLYVAADLQTARTLAAILVHVGAVRAIELDINPEWPTFNAYGRPGGLDPVKFVPNYQQSPTRYLVPDDRDFFAVLRRTSPHGPDWVPFR